MNNENSNSVESYIMKAETDELMENTQPERTLIVKRMELNFNDMDCQVLNFSDITTYKQLKHEEETSRLLRALNASAHHEMLGPLKANIEISARLVKRLKDQELKRMSQTILISSKLVLLHANDLLDQQHLSKGQFSPFYEPGSVWEALFEIVEMINHTLKGKKVKIRCYVAYLKAFPTLSFDRRRLQ